MLERLDLRRDLHFQTNTTIDTLDYSGTGLNQGSKVVIAAYGDKLRELCQDVPDTLKGINGFANPRLVLPGIVAIEGPDFTTHEQAKQELAEFCQGVKESIPSCPMIILCDDSKFVAEDFQNFLWVTFTRSNPSHDIHGINSFYEHKHWGCDNMIIDARLKPHHAPPLVLDKEVERKIERFFEKGAVLAKN